MKHFKFLVLIFYLLSTNSYAAEKILSSEKDTLRLLNLFGEVFEKVKKDYVNETNDSALIEASLNGMLTSLDPHSGYLNEQSFEEMKVQTKGEFGGLGMEVTLDNGVIKVMSPIDDTPAFKAGIKIGDYIVAIDNEPVMGLSLNEAVKKMRGKAGEVVKLTIIRENLSEPLELALTREIIKITPVKSRVEGENIGYIRITTFSEHAAEAVKEEINKLKSSLGKKFQGLIIDLRNNPGGLLTQAIDITDLFLDNGEIVSTRGKDVENIIRYNAKKGKVIGGLPIVVLLNGGSASAAEIVAGALQDHKIAIIMGTKSFGKGSVQSVITLPGHGAIKLTTARYYTPLGRSIQAEGIIPDIIVEPAKIEFLEKNDLAKLYSESNLRGHLRNETAKKDAKNVNDKPNKSDLIPQNYSAITENKLNLKVDSRKLIYEQDYQLARAIDLIRGIFTVKQFKLNID